MQVNHSQQSNIFCTIKRNNILTLWRERHETDRSHYYRWRRNRFQRCLSFIKEGFEGEILIFEKDSLYEYSSTPRSAGGIRQLFTTAINIQISRYSLQKYLTFPEDMAVNGEPAEIDFRQHGYFFLAQDENWAELKAQAELQRNYGVPSELLTPDELQNVIPELTTDDLVGGLYCAEDGYLDPYSVMQGYAKMPSN